MSIFNVHFKLSFQQNKQLWLKALIFALSSSTLIFGLMFSLYYQSRIYQGVSIDKTPVGGLTKEQALERLKEQQPTKAQGSLEISIDRVIRKASLAAITTGRDYQTALNKAFRIGRQGFVTTRLQTIISLISNPINIESQPELNQQGLDQLILELKNDIDYPPIEPKALLETSGQLTSLKLDTGRDGRELLRKETLANIKERLLTEFKNDYFSQNSTLTIPALVASTSAKLSPDGQITVRNRVEDILNKKIILTHRPEEEVKEHSPFLTNPNQQVTVQLNDQQIVSLMDLPTGFAQEKIKDQISAWAETINRKPTAAQFAYEPETLEVKEFQPHLLGRELARSATNQEISRLLTQVESSAEPQLSGELFIKQTEPDKTLAETNNLGIKQLIGFGDSHYDHSIPSRIHNVGITAEKLSFAMVEPGEKFSFNQSIGEVSQATGYKPAYIIKNGRTILGDGGGVCQVSTTLFRALLDAGLEISKRLPHSYRVSYYELDRKPGFDATVYAGDVDLRFVNDTDRHLLIYSQANSEDLYMKVEIYGTDDGRTTEIKNYKKWGYRPPPPPQYIPEESLPPGAIKQIDWATSGIKTSFDWVVKAKNGDIIREKTYYSSYRPWSAKYLQGV